MPVKISHQFDAGSIEVLRADSPGSIELNIRKDTNADFLQWFYFRLQGARDEPCMMRFLNAGQAAFPLGWEDYRAVASYDRKSWFRVPTTYSNGVLTVSHTPERDSIYYAYFEPYFWERHLDLLANVDKAANGRILDLGSTLEGREINLAVIGDPAARHKIWVIARQHPGETMAEWFIEGMLEALLDSGNPVARQLLEQAVFYVVPNMNPDGAAHGNLRTNAAGVNLNREWMAPSMERSPEVFVVKERMHQTGCDLFIDVHGDEAMPYVFVAGCEMLEGFSAQQLAQQQLFIDSFQRASVEFQTRYGYDAAKYKQEMLQLASKYVGHTFKCVSLTLEMPFKDNVNLPNADTGWNGERSARLGAAILQPMLDVLEREAA